MSYQDWSYPEFKLKYPEVTDVINEYIAIASVTRSHKKTLPDLLSEPEMRQKLAAAFQRDDEDTDIYSSDVIKSFPLFTEGCTKTMVEIFRKEIVNAILANNNQFLVYAFQECLEQEQRDRFQRAKERYEEGEYLLARMA